MEQTHIGVVFDEFDINTDASGEAVVEFTLDGDESTDSNNNVGIDVDFKFNQSSQNTDANIGFLALSSVAVNPTDETKDDLTITASYKEDVSKQKSIETEFDYD